MSAPVSSPTASSSSSKGDPPTPFMIMGDLIDKLKLLHYETEVLKRHSEFKALNPIYFIFQSKPTEQFSYFLSLCSFLLKIINPQSDAIEFNEFDDPTSVGSALCEQIKRVGMTVDFPPSKLRLGSGDQVLLILDYLCDRAIARSKIVLTNPVYRESDAIGRGDEKKGSHDDDDEDDKKTRDGSAEDDIQDEVEEDGAFETEATASTSKLESKGEEAMAASFASPLPTVDPNEWKLELERVGPKLKVKASTGMSSKEWRSRIELAGKHFGELNEVIPNTKSALEKMHINLKKVVEKIQSSEKKINKEFEGLGGEYHETQKDYEETQEKYNLLQKDLGVMTNEFQRYSDEVDELKHKMSEKNNQMNDTQPLRKITTALNEIKKEINSMELRIGIVGQTLQMMRLKVYNEEFKKQTAAIQMMKKSGGGSHSGKKGSAKDEGSLLRDVGE